ncbi:MAG TPA: condensation domain-containing protein, partial [Trebonia sp.]
RGLTRMHAEFDTGEDAWTGPLAWGQRSIWEAIRQVGPAGDKYFNFSRVVPVPRGAPVADVDTVVAALSVVVARHDSLRTRVRTGPDGEPYQVVGGGGGIPVEIVESAADVERLEGVRFEFAADWPLRVALVVSEDRVREVVLVFCHVAADGYAADLVARDLRLTLLRGAPPGEPEQLRGLVAAQSGQDVSRSERAMEFWAAQSLGGPLLDQRRDPSDGARYQRAVIFSPAMDRASRVLAQRYGVNGSTILLVAACVLVGRAAGRQKSAMTPLVNNRFLARHSEVVTSLAQLGLLVVDSGPADFNELMASARASALRAYRHAYYDQAALNERVAGADPLCCFNDQRSAETTGVPIPAGPEPGETVVEAESGLDELNCRFCVHVTGDPGQLKIMATADTHYLQAGDLETLLRGMESLVVAGAAAG